MLKSYEGFLESNLLWTAKQFGLHQFILPILDIDIKNFTSIPSNLRLGHQVEHIYLEILKASKSYKVLAHSVQLIDNKQTLGELDYIIKSLKSNEIIHIELAYKFYLLDSNLDSPIEGLVGPNRNDAFTYKLNKTRNKQMPLLYSEASKRILKIDVENIIQKVAFYAQIFIPYENKKLRIGILNADCIVGYWMPMDFFQSYEFVEKQYYFPQKSEWIHLPHNDVKWQSFSDTLDTLKQRHALKRSPMIWIKNTDYQIDKVFVTHWS